MFSILRVYFLRRFHASPYIDFSCTLPPSIRINFYYACILLSRYYYDILLYVIVVFVISIYGVQAERAFVVYFRLYAIIIIITGCSVRFDCMIR